MSQSLSSRWRKALGFSDAQSASQDILSPLSGPTGPTELGGDDEASTQAAQPQPASPIPVEVTAATETTQALTKQDTSTNRGQSDTPTTALAGCVKPTTPEKQSVGTYTGERQSITRILSILAAHDEGTPPRDIAALIHADVRTVEAVIARYGPEDARAEGARKLLAANSIQSVQDWIQASRRGAELGKHQAAKELLLHAKVIDPIEDKPQAAGVQIVIGMAGQPAGPDPLAGAKVASNAPSVVHEASAIAVSD